MNWKYVSLSLLLVHFPFSIPHCSVLAELSAKTIENFEKYKVDNFPTFFKTWPFQRGKAKRVYQIGQEKNNKYLAADDKENLSTQIFREFDWKLQDFPYFKWRWRARVLPEGAKENDPGKNDSACGVYIVFGKMSGTALKFTWSTSLKEGTVYEKTPGEIVIKILDSGKKHLNQWRTHSIHIEAAYEALLKTPMKREPTGFAILTDGNAVQKEAACDYDDFEISTAP